MRNFQRVPRIPHKNLLSQQNSGINSNRMFLLRLLWEQQNIENCYQTIFEQYFSFLPLKILEEEIEQEIRQVKSKRSFCFTIKNLSYNRMIILQQLSSQIETFQSSKIKTEQDIQTICTSIHKLRDSNLLYAQTLLSLHHYYTSKIQTFQIYTQLAPFFIALNADNQPLKRSLMRKYIVFSSSYDPFFLKHYQLLKKTSNFRLKELPAIESLFTIPLNQVYRLTKAHQEIKQYLQHVRYEEDLMSTINKEQKPPISDFNRKRYNQRKNSVNDVYLHRKSIHSGSLSPPSYSKNGATKETNFGSYSSDRKQLEREGSLFPRIKTIGMMDEDQISVIKDNQRYGELGNSRNSIGSPEGRRRYFDNKVNLVTQKDEQFKKYVFPKRFERNNTDASQKNQSSLTKNAKKDPTYLNSKIYFTQRNNSTEPVKSKNIEVQCDEFELGHNNRKISDDNAERRQKAFKRRKEEEQESEIQERKPKGTIYRKSKPMYTTAEQQTKPEVIFQTQPEPPKEQEKKTKKAVEKESKIKQKKYRLKASDKNDTVEEIFKTLERLKINPKYRSNFQIGNWQKSVIHNQYYFHKSFINDQLQAVSLCCALPEGDITIKYWGPLDTCDEEMSIFLFSKYLQHLQKSTLLKSIYFNANFIKQLTANNFIQKKERIYERTRTISQKIQEAEYTYFLSVNFTNVAISKSTENKNELIIQNNIKEFQTQKFIIFNYLLIINKLMYPGSFSAVASYHSKLKSVQKLHETIISKYLPQDAYNLAFKCQNINLLTLKIRSPIFSAFFTADQGYIKVVGQVVYSNSQTLIIGLPLLKYSSKMYFGKGIKSAADMLEKVRSSAKTNYQRIQFSIRMFKKRLRGKILAINLKDEDCLGDLEINFVWKDYLKGKIVHSMTDCEQIFNEAFYCLLQMEKETMFVFEVQPEEFVAF